MIFLVILNTCHTVLLRLTFTLNRILAQVTLADFGYPDEGYSRNALCALNLISTFLLTISFIYLYIFSLILLNGTGVVKVWTNPYVKRYRTA
jgi:hypothetical protein